jgi:CDP-diacylglycerol--glycerol-3-phosphate 3-phosphatidyltransferase
MSRLTLPNLLGLFRLAATPVLVALILWPFPGAGFLAFWLYVPAALSDFVDGRIARARNQVTTFGVFLDLTADKVLVAGVLIALTQTDLVPAWIVIVILVRELVVGGVRQVAANEQIVVGSQMLGKAKTVVTMIAIAVLLLAFDAEIGGPLSSTGLEPVLVVSGVWLLFAGMLLAVISGLDYLRAAWPILAGEDLAGEDPPAT